MNITKKLIIKFSTQLILVLFILLLFLTIGIFMISNKVLETDVKNDFTNVSQEYLEQSIKYKNNRIYVNDVIQNSIKTQNGSLRIINRQGKVQFSINVSKASPQQYNRSEISSMINNHNPYETKYWTISVSGKKFIVLYHILREPELLLNKVKNVYSTERKINTLEKKELKLNKANFYAFNIQGEKVYSYISNKKLKEPKIFDIVNYQNQPWEKKENISTFYDEHEKTTIVVQLPNPNFHTPLKSETDINKDAVKSIGIILFCLIIILFVIAFWYAYKFGKPILHIINWLHFLEKGNYFEPKDKTGIPVSIHPQKSQLKPSFKTFSEVINSLKQLTINLRENELHQKYIDETREEWIAGLSHDLRTPLSGIYGSAVMLNSSDYQWSIEEERELYSSIEKNAAYMSELIEDLNLTYRIKNNSLPIHKKRTEINMFLEEVTEHFFESCIGSNQEYLIRSTTEHIYYPIDEKYFQRVLNNLLSNAVKYNPSGTLVTIETLIKNSHYEIRISDNGIGMDSNTVKNLFNRYYRGTNVQKNTEGTGLGLAITKQLIELHNGEIQVHSKLHEGTVIIIKLPK